MSETPKRRRIVFEPEDASLKERLETLSKRWVTPMRVIIEAVMVETKDADIKRAVDRWAARR